jgi:hypothetical protein
MPRENKKARSARYSAMAKKKRGMRYQTISDRRREGYYNAEGEWVPGYLETLTTERRKQAAVRYFHRTVRQTATEIVRTTGLPLEWILQQIRLGNPIGKCMKGRNNQMSKYRVTATPESSQKWRVDT